MKLKTGEEKMKNKDMTKIANKIIEKINEAIWAGDVETIKKCFPQIDKNDKQIQAELTWTVAKDVMKNRELRELYFQKYGVKYKVRKEKRRNS